MESSMNDTLKAAGRIGAELGAAKAEVERLRGLLHGAHDTIRNLAEDLDEEEFQVTIDQLAEIELALAPQQAEPKCSTCNDVGIIGHSNVCPDCADTWKQHTEPTDTYTAVDMATAAAQGFRDGQAAVEPAPAQDEREAPIVVATAILGGLFHGGSGPELGEIDIEVCTPALETIQCETVNSSDDVFLPLMTVAQHERIVGALARPAQTEQQPVAAPKCATCNGFGKELSVYEGGIPCRSCKSDPAPAPDEREAFKRALHSQRVFKLSAATINAAEWAWFHRPAQTEQPEQSGLVEALRTEALGLCDVVEKINSLSPVTYALQAGRAINKVRDAAAALSAQWTAEQ
jgi:hypothetical protein